MASTSLTWTHWDRARSPGAQAAFLAGGCSANHPLTPDSQWAGWGGGTGQETGPLLSQPVEESNRAQDTWWIEDSSLLRAQEMISMQMRCKLLNEFAIRSPSLPGPGNAFGFYEWARAGRGSGAPVRPHSSLSPSPRHAAPHVAASRPAATWPPASGSAAPVCAGGCRPESPPRCLPASRWGRGHAPWGPAGALSSGAPFPVMGKVSCSWARKASLWAGRALAPNLWGCTCVTLGGWEPRE